MEKHDLEQNNTVAACGTISGEFEFDHKVYGERFYTTTLDIERKSGTVDKIILMVSEHLVNVKEEWTGRKVNVWGQYRSHYMPEYAKKRLALFVFATEIFPCEEEMPDINEAFLDGYICKTPYCRITPLGRELCDVILAVNRQYGKTDYIPCIFWGRNARFMSAVNVGCKVKVWGRMQSREYTKKISKDESETMVAYEVSVRKMEVLEGEQKED